MNNIGTGKMNPDLIVMLTYNDKTVENAEFLFESLKEIPVRYWGFKDVGLSFEAAKKLVGKLKDAGKTIKLEVVSLTEEEGLKAAKRAVEFGIDVLMGTVYYDSINDYLKDKPVKYVPFVGSISGHPSILDGDIDEIVNHVQELESKGVDGIDLLTYRYTGDAVKLLSEVVKGTNLRVISAGSIDSFERMTEVCNAGAWAFTIGSAFFDKKFVPGGSFENNVLEVMDWEHNV